MAFPSVRTLKEYYLSDIDQNASPQGLVLKLFQAYEGGKQQITDPSNITALQSTLTAAAALGKSSFTFNFVVVQSPIAVDTIALALKGSYYNNFCDGIRTALAEQAIASSEIIISLIVTNSATVTLSFNF